MPDFAINHMTIARDSFETLLDIASALGCVGIEVRNDLPRPLFDGVSASTAGKAAAGRQLRILALSEVKSFNQFTEDTRRRCWELIDTATACGAEAISLIPANDGIVLGKSQRMRQLQHALQELKPMLEDSGLVGLVEPLGFATCAITDKAELVEVIEVLDATAQFKLVHDTFHHYIAGGGAVFPQHTGMVHISGVVDAALELGEMLDEHRVLVDQRDRLGNLEQLASLIAQGYSGPVSFEVFSPSVHVLTDLKTALAESVNYIADSLPISATYSATFSDA